MNTITIIFTVFFVILLVGMAMFDFLCDVKRWHLWRNKFSGEVKRVDEIQQFNSTWEFAGVQYQITVVRGRYEGNTWCFTF